MGERPGRGRQQAATANSASLLPLLHCRTFARYVAGGQVRAPRMPGRIHTCAQRRRRQASMLSQVSESACLLLHGGCPGSSSEITTSFFRPLEEPLQIGPDQTRLGSLQRPWLDGGREANSRESATPRSAVDAMFESEESTQ